MEHKARYLWRLISLILTCVLICSMPPCTSLAERSPWKCPECGRTGNTGNFCGNCAHPAPKPVKAGDIVSFGRYEQDNHSKNGREAIEWIVLEVDKKNNKALLLSRYGLRGKPYNTKKTNITWEKSALRDWLNDKFLKSVFSKKERAAILTTNVDNGSSQRYSGWKTKGGNNTKDKVFLLSYSEANRYLGVSNVRRKNNESRVELTAYAIKQGAWVSNVYQAAYGETIGWWWLRSPGSSQNNAARVLSDGSLGSANVNSDNGAVRPALWVSLEAGTF